MKRISIILAFAISYFSSITTANSQTTIEMDIDDFVRLAFIEGVPYEDAAKYDQTYLPILINMLKDPNEIDHWGNIVAVMGIIGDESSLDEMIAFIEGKPSLEYTETYDRAKTSAIVSIGYLINKSNSDRAVKYLEKMSFPENWEAKKIPGLTKRQKTYANRNRKFSRYAVIGLGLAGNEKSELALKRIKSIKFKDKAYQDEIDGVVDSTISENKKIRKLGLKKYYEEESM
ncbi:hypothetical protein GNX18_10680 [Microbulbifer sp. SH-1]|uniref:hypothetical protein n=1 Tax=Microbulbifer sp. SH-1 TaxID=2681547 RepID=UPI00140D4B0D|nr:hypothetical protein [Microbulbifer sp. SH-1]QIL90170.1 hypothetical protein GNX18_10680 [Microbulbifer sp. SH-1]